MTCSYFNVLGFDRACYTAIFRVSMCYHVTLQHTCRIQVCMTYKTTVWIFTISKCPNILQVNVLSFYNLQMFLIKIEKEWRRTLSVSKMNAILESSCYLECNNVMCSVRHGNNTTMFWTNQILSIFMLLNLKVECW